MTYAQVQEAEKMLNRIRSRINVMTRMGKQTSLKTEDKEKEISKASRETQ